MVAMEGVTMAVVDVVDVVAMRDGHVATALAVNMGVLPMHLVPVGGLTFVVVIVVPSMKVAIVNIVDVITVRDCNMSAAFAVDVRVIGVFVVNCLGHRFPPPFRPGCACYRCSRLPPYDTTGRDGDATPLDRSPRGGNKDTRRYRSLTCCIRPRQNGRSRDAHN
jgi:hypothetical protein